MQVYERLKFRSLTQGRSVIPPRIPGISRTFCRKGFWEFHGALPGRKIGGFYISFYERPFLSKDFLSKFSLFFSRIFLCFHIFHFFFQIFECEACQMFCPLLNFQSLERFPVFPSFPVSLGKKEETLGKKLLD